MNKFLPILFMVLMLGFAGYYLSALDKLAEESMSWPSQEAILISAKIDIYETKRHVEGGLSKKYVPNYRVLVEYSFELDGVEYKNDNVSYSMSTFDSKEMAEAVLAEVKKDPFVIYYNPENPNQSVVIPGK